MVDRFLSQTRTTKITKYKASSDSPFLEEFEEIYSGLSRKYFASDLSSLGIDNGQELTTAVQRAMQACRAAGLSVNRNFKKVYISKGGDIFRDWKISALARKLIILNADPSNPIIAKLQVKLAQRI